MTTYEATSCSSSLLPAARKTTTNGTAVDLTAGGGTDDVLVAVMAGTMTDGTHAITVQDSADGSTGWTDVPADRLTGSLPTLDGNSDNARHEIGVRAESGRPYMRVVATVTGSPATGGVYGAIVIGSPRYNPGSHA